VRAPKLLHDLGGRPAELGHDVQAPPLVLLLAIGVQREASRTGLREDRDELLARLEARALEQVDLAQRRALLRARPVLVYDPPVHTAHRKQPVRPPRHLGDVPDAKEVDEGIERRGRQIKIVELALDPLGEAVDAIAIDIAS
jgi:hypothetical protein